jgi:hypothetical protein
MDDLQRELQESPVDQMEMSAWLALRAEDAQKADARVAVVRSKNWETWGAPQYNLEKIVVKVDTEKGEVKMWTAKLDKQY